MTSNDRTRYCVDYTGLGVQQLQSTLLQHMGNVKKSVAERIRHQRQYDRRKALGQSKQCKMISSRLGNDTYADDADIRPIYVDDPMDEGRVVLYPETCQVKSPLLDSSLITRTLNTQNITRFGKIFMLKEKVSANFKKFFQEWKHMAWLSERKWSKSNLEKSGQHGQILNETSGNHGLEIFKSVGLGGLYRKSYSTLAQPRTTISTEGNQAAKTVTTSNELDLLFGPLFDEYFNGENQVVLKPSAVTTTDASNKRQQQPDSTSSTSTLAITVTANGNFYIDKMTVLQAHSSEVGFINHMLILKLSKSIVQHQDS
ncbi:hypothetical protein Tco_0287484 [Tanacetum coccineum]